MKQTNYQLFDFLDFDPERLEVSADRLWRAGRPLAIESFDKGIIVHVPFHCQKPAVDIQPDSEVAPQSFEVHIRAFGERVLRVTAELGQKASKASPMLEIADDLEEVPLSIEKADNEWVIKDDRQVVRAIIDLTDPVTDWWSDLLPPPEPVFQATFFPDGKKAVKLNGHDQFFPARVDAMGLAMISENEIPTKATLSFAAQPDEKFVGTGERFTKMDLSGRTFQLKNQDGQGVNNRRTYKNIPFYLSSEMYGLFLHTSAYGKISLADHSTRSVQLLVEEPLADVFLLGGDNPHEILHEYRRLTGFPAMPPLWTFGVWMSRMTYFSAEEVEGICDRLRAERFPCDVIHLDTGWFETDWLCEWKFNTDRFPHPKGFVQKLKKQGYRVSLWQMPYIAANAMQHEEAKANNYIGPLKESKVQGGSNFSALDYAGTIDFTYPAAVEWYKGLLRELLEMGVTCIKTDFGEEIHLDAAYHDMPAPLLNNLYALLYQKAAFEVTEEVAGEGVVWARAGWAGCQRYPIHWGGDAAASWDGMAGSLKGGLHLGLSGFGFWSHDVPGFHGVPNFMNSVIPDDLYVRWTQFGVFTSHIRYHGTSKREPYEYPAIADVVRKWWELRYVLLPYILEQSQQSIRSGMPMLRAMLLHFPDDPMCWHLDDQYFFGEDFLVAPVMNSGNARKVYLPEGSWVDFFTGTCQEGPKWVAMDPIPLEEMPVWVKQGASIPIYPTSVSCTDEMDFKKTQPLVIDGGFNGIWQVLKEKGMD
ncbi:TIM-barrel domain-containing protein [Echinicola vietnamensis]|uniref:Family 31 glycosyl hydrolase, alpha-glucosidase n=1 Tax=Echinicola vietnamensis (strain DSM 17526 / LMG 23754 / KMM 6221) TaxID=926556 RepID=L0FXA8_ECHVK|nr:TIM-barrel domain-containing protein [Echinicola vietnamensis]AGA77942.1 family 31 glycosyl hydrolase, alpha-glucosidase [Echinicola vietnamensis DSM 17526]